MNKQDFINWALSRGWQQDKWGYLHKEFNGRQYRFKVSNIAVRYEVKVSYDSGGSDWVRLNSGYFKDLSLTEDNKLTGLRSRI